LGKNWIFYNFLRFSRTNPNFDPISTNPKQKKGSVFSGLHPASAVKMHHQSLTSKQLTELFVYALIRRLKNYSVSSHLSVN